jgi:hypothetical protein
MTPLMSRGSSGGMWGTAGVVAPKADAYGASISVCRQMRIGLSGRMG